MADQTTKAERAEGASASPQFIIESNGVYYLTMAVWAYDPALAGASPVHGEGVDQIKQTFEGLVTTDSKRDAVQLPQAQVLFAQHTAPA